MDRIARSNLAATARIGGVVPRVERTLVVLDPEESVSESHLWAIQREFPWMVIERVPDVAAACRAFDQRVSLILADGTFLDDLNRHLTELSCAHPDARTALIQADSRRPVSAADVFASPAVSSVLPMDLKLDVWLSVVGLLLRGGEYYPVGMLQSLAKDPAARSAGSRQDPNAIAQTAKNPCEALKELTERELEILQMVGRGAQNKIIAADLGLSEHTVKIHLHHIITKLGAHNRTEAAIIFHGCRGDVADNGKPPSPPPSSKS